MSPGVTGYSSRARSMPADRGADDVVQVLLAAAVALHRVEAQLHRRDVVPAVGAADDLVDRALHRQRRRLDELGPVEELEVAVERAAAPRRDRDHLAELPVVLARQADALGVGDAPHDRRRHRAAEVAVQLGQGCRSGEHRGHGPMLARPEAHRPTGSGAIRCPRMRRDAVSSVGILNEKPLHDALKRAYARPGDLSRGAGRALHRRHPSRRPGHRGPDRQLRPAPAQGRDAPRGPRRAARRARASPQDRSCGSPPTEPRSRPGAPPSAARWSTSSRTS